ncbi:aerotolerance regulator BatA [Halioglobus sp. HI00S01]|uniref:vWA domain-containing protein n=1 Tax=Halioglobus sp. HI00S01 TaxID=1822214 RepID=UPI0007C330EA|nr:VWA domain-containing protein [Halioglobus sp. HI00S01]KZX58244.1 aerotolerance regulator BatA [Halioglobus sp. HI00S01]
MIELALPWALLLLPLPVLMRLLPAYKESRDSVKVPFFDQLVAVSEQRPEEGARILRRDRVQKILVAFTWLCLVLAATKPQWIGAPIEQQKSGRDLMVAVDLSGSMEARDFALPDGTTLNRLEAVKIVLDELASQRSSDRLGLIVFGAAAYLQTPFTDDHEVWQQLLGETEIGMAGPSTVFGDAIGLAIKLFRESTSDSRVLIMLTDGNDTGSTVPPVDAAKVAAANNIRIYTIAIGDPTTVGEDALDTQTIERVSELTRGRSFQALDQAQMREAYATIASMEPELYESVSFRPRQNLHWVPVAVAVIAFICYHLFMAAWTWRQGRLRRAA